MYICQEIFIRSEMILYILFINLIIAGVESQNIERVVVPQGHPFTFDCQLDQSVYFARRLNEWTEIQENNEKYFYLNLNFDYLTKENILRVTSDSAEPKHNGFYGCRKASWTSTSMNTVYQLILAGNEEVLVDICQRFDLKMFNHFIGILFVMVRLVLVNVRMI